MPEQSESCFARIAWSDPLARIFAGAAALLLLTPLAWAETTSPSSSSGRAAAYIQGGFSTAFPHMDGASGGGSLVLHVGKRLALEGLGAYLDRGAGSAAASLSASLILDLAPREEEAVPYLAVGGGVYRTSFDTANARFSGPAPSGEMGTGRDRHVMKVGPPGWDLGQLPPFYGNRTAALIAREGRTGLRSFTDPALNIGAGMRIRLGRSWSLREDARAQVAMRDGAVYLVGLFTIHVGHGF